MDADSGDDDDDDDDDASSSAAAASGVFDIIKSATAVAAALRPENAAP